MSASQLFAAVLRFERIYRTTGAGAEVQIRREIDGEPIETNAILRFVPPSSYAGVDVHGERIPAGPWGLFVFFGGDGESLALRDAPPAVMGRAARHLPELAARLDDVVTQIEAEVVAGVDVLERWLTERGA